MVKVDDILHFLVARTTAPSTMGAQLDRMRNGYSIAPDPFRSRDEAESSMLSNANILRALDEFSHRDEFRSANRDAYASLQKIQKHCMSQPKMPQGAIAVGILRSYQERTTSPERALVEVYRFIGSIAPKAVPPPPKNEDDLVMAFRNGKAVRSRTAAASAYADSLLALGSFLQVFNKKHD